MKKITKKFDLEKFVDVFKNASAPKTEGKFISGHYTIGKDIEIHEALSKAYGYKDVYDDDFLKFKKDFLWAMLEPYMAKSIFEENFKSIDDSFNYIPIIAFNDEHPLDMHWYRHEYGFLSSKKTKYSFITYFDYSWTSGEDAWSLSQDFSEDLTNMTLNSLNCIKVFNNITQEQISKIPLSIDIFLKTNAHLSSGYPSQDVLLNDIFEWDYKKIKGYFDEVLKMNKEREEFEIDSYDGELPEAYYDINFYLIDSKKFYKNKFLNNKTIFQL